MILLQLLTAVIQVSLHYVLQVAVAVVGVVREVLVVRLLQARAVLVVLVETV
jgi:hypothetical protein